MRRLALVVALLALGACSDSDSAGPRVPTIDEMRVLKVSGDQTSRVPEDPPVAAQVRISADQLALDGYTPEPLVARVEVVGETGGLLEPSGGAPAPAGIPVHWQISTDAGKLFAAMTLTDDSAYIVNRWAPGTRAGAYEVAAGRLDGPQIVIDAVWEVTVEPGEPTQPPVWAKRLHTADRYSLHSINRAQDRYGNEIPWRFEVDCACASVGSTDYADRESRIVYPVEAGTGTITIVSPYGILNEGTVEVYVGDGGRWWLYVEFNPELAD